MKKFFMTCLSMLLLILLSSFTPQQAAQKSVQSVNAQRSFDTISVGYFWADGKLYHAYGDAQHSDIVDIWTVDVFLNDETQITDFFGYWFNYIDGRYNLDLGLWDNGVYHSFEDISHFYPGMGLNQ